MSRRNKKLVHDYNISISVVIETEDMDEATAYADALMEDVLGDEGIVDAIWYQITPIRKCRPKNGAAKRRVRRPTRKNV